MNHDPWNALIDLIPPNGVIGLGTGRAATAFLRRLAERVKAGFPVRGVPTSEATAGLARELGLLLTTLAEVAELDVAFDGADEVDPQGNVIKGYGGALVREKIVAAAAKQFVVLIGTEKLVPVLGTRGKLPLEVVPFALAPVLRRLASLHMPGTARPTPSDNGNVIVDCAIPLLTAPADTEATLRRIPGVVDTGLFLQMATLVAIERDAGVELRPVTARG